MRRLVWIVAVLLILTAVGTGWFWLVEGWSFLDAIYMTVITLSTVGYEEVQPLSDRSRIFVMVFFDLWAGVFFFSIVQLGEAVVRAGMGNWLRRRGTSSALKRVNDYVDSAAWDERASGIWRIRSCRSWSWIGRGCVGRV